MVPLREGGLGFRVGNGMGGWLDWPLIQIIPRSALEQPDPRAEILHLKTSRKEFHRDLISVAQPIYRYQVLIDTRNTKNIFKLQRLRWSRERSRTSVCNLKS